MCPFLEDNSVDFRDWEGSTLGCCKGGDVCDSIVQKHVNDAFHHGTSWQCWYNFSMLTSNTIMSISIGRQNSQDSK